MLDKPPTMRGVRVFLVGLVVALVGVGAAQAEPPFPGFRESPKLEVPASFVAGRPAQVWCASSESAWFAATDAVQAPNNALGFAFPEAATIFLRFCTPLEVWKPHAPVGYEFAGALITLVHEGIHASGLRDELLTECLAKKRVAEVAIRFFGFRPRTSRLRALVRLAYTADGRVPAATSC